MSDSTPTPEPIVDAAPTPPTRAGGLALAALIVGIVAIVCAIIPGLSFIAFLPAITAAILGVIALVTRKPRRGFALAGVILGPVALLVAIVVSISAIVGNVTPQVSAGSDPSDKPSAEAPAKPTEQPAVEVGTRSNPAPAGSTLEISDNSGPIWNITVGAATLNANDIVAAENQFNPVADAGTQYVLVPITFTYVGTQSGTPWIDTEIEFVSAAGTTHEQEFVVIPNSITDIAEMYEGASATGNLVVMAPTLDVEKGTWAISARFGTKYFVAVQ